MSSRFGPRVRGTDGSDFHHRQKIAIHYKDSITYKFRLKCVLVLHMLVLALISVNLLDEILEWFQVGWSPLRRLQLPDSQLWEWWWWSSAVSIVLALMALPKNKEKLMRWFYSSIFLLGLMPVAVGAGTLFPDLIDYVQNPRKTDVATFRGFPVVVLWFMFFALALQIHGFSMYFALQLIKMWKPISQTRKITPANGTVSENKKEN